MQVRSLKSNRKLIKGHVYETDYFNNNSSATGNITYFFGRIHLKDIGYYQVCDFTQLDGTPMPSIVYDVRPQSVPVQAKDLKKGDIIVCKSDSKFKYLIKDGKYRIEDVRVNNSGSYWTSGQIKLEGYKRWLAWNTWNFRKLSLQESRDLALSQIFDKEENFSVDFKRKFEQTSNQEKLLIETIAKSMIDKYRHGLDIIDWGIEKNSQSFDIKREDFDSLLDKSFREIIEIFEKS